MTRNPAPGAASIIIPCWNQLEFTRQCIAALLRHTHGPWELIVIDNGSTDGTAGYLANLRDAAPLPVTLISNTKNLGFPAAINQGLRCARGDYLVLLNNDVVVTEGWLAQLIGLASIAPPAARGGAPAGGASGTDGIKNTREPEARAPEISEVRNAYPGRDITVIDFATGNKRGDGPAPSFRQDPDAAANTLNPRSNIALVGPMSNYAAPPQLVENVPYRDLTELYLFARQWRDQHRGSWIRVHKLSGFCVLMKRAVYEAIGGLDEQFGLGFFDDDDLAERARRAGFELAVACDLFVHHFGSRTFAGNGVDAEKVLEENAVKFAAKWGSAVPEGRRVTLRPFKPETQIRQEKVAGARPAPGSAPPRSVARISLTMIVKNEEANLPHALGSVRGLFDEIVVVDTGSRDRTVKIAQDFGARVVHFAWVDDFAAARNIALAHATGEYVFWLDADDLIEPPERKKLEDLLSRIRTAQPVPLPAGSSPDGNRAMPPPCAYVLRCACDPGPERRRDRCRSHPVVPSTGRRALDIQGS
jgi:glycosyltransferase involved in cell wall biosynthesis